MKYLIIILTLVSGCKAISQTENRVLHHSIEFTASSVKLIEFEIKPKSGESYVKETIDSLNRTNKLEFYNWRGELDWAGSGFYGGPIIKYTYNDNEIIETFFLSESEIFNDFQWSEAPYKFIYELDNDGNIKKVNSVYKIDFEFDKESIDSTINHLKFYKQFAAKNKDEIIDIDHVFGYTYAKGKFNGKHPKIKN